MSAGSASAESALAAGWAWLASLPRAAVAHGERGAEPLAAVERLLAALGSPQQHLRVIHVAGSKGKGSTALYLEALLAECGQRTLTFTSPHLERWTERLRLDGAEADPETALDALRQVQRAAAATGTTPGFFEALTVAALWLAAERGIDWAVIEAGVGGRADATNVVRPRAAVITGIELEHTDRLGDTLEAITREKAGIIKPGAPVLAPRLDDELDAVLAAAAEAAGSEFLRLCRAPARPRGWGDSRRIRWYLDDGALSLAGADWALRAPFGGGDTMATNAALALATLARLGIASRETLQRAARALDRVRLPGRMETVSELPWVLVDGAHTAASATALAAELQRLAPPRLHLLLSLTAGKDPDAVLSPLLPLADAVTVTRADADYSQPAEALAAAIRAHPASPPPMVEPDPDAALAGACSDRPGETLVVATGSVYLAGRVRGAFRPSDSRRAPRSGK